MPLAQSIVLAVAVVGFVLGLVYFLVTLLGRQIERLDDRVQASVQALGDRVQRLDDRVQASAQVLGDLRVDVADLRAEVRVIGQRLDDHLTDPRAHSAA